MQNLTLGKVVETELGIIDKSETLKNVEISEPSEIEYGFIKTELDKTGIRDYIKKMIYLWNKKIIATSFIKEYRKLNLFIKKIDVQKTVDIELIRTHIRGKITKSGIQLNALMLISPSSNDVIITIILFYSIKRNDRIEIVPIRNQFSGKFNTSKFIWPVLYYLDLVRRYPFSIEHSKDDFYKEIDFRSLFYLSQGSSALDKSQNWYVKLEDL